MALRLYDIHVLYIQCTYTYADSLLDLTNRLVTDKRKIAGRIDGSEKKQAELIRELRGVGGHVNEQTAPRRDQIISHNEI